CHRRFGNRLVGGCHRLSGLGLVSLERIHRRRIAELGRESAASLERGARQRKNPGDDLFSRKAALSVSSALESLTSVFGMGTGVASPPESPGSLASGSFRQRPALGPFWGRGAPE